MEKEISVDNFGQCNRDIKSECECRIHAYRKHCIKCSKLFGGITLIRNELCPDCAKVEK